MKCHATVPPNVNVFVTFTTICLRSWVLSGGSIAAHPWPYIRQWEPKNYDWEAAHVVHTLQ